MPLIRSNVDNENLEIFDTATTRRKVDWIRPAESVLNNRTNYCYKSVAAVVGEIREKINIFQKKKKRVRRSTYLLCVDRRGNLQNVKKMEIIWNVSCIPICY